MWFPLIYFIVLLLSVIPSSRITKRFYFQVCLLSKGGADQWIRSIFSNVSILKEHPYKKDDITVHQYQIDFNNENVEQHSKHVDSTITEMLVVHVHKWTVPRVPRANSSPQWLRSNKGEKSNSQEKKLKYSCTQSHIQCINITATVKKVR